MSLTNCDTNDKNNQQADRRSNHQEILFKRLQVVQMKINGEPDQHHVVLRFALQRRRA